MTNINLLPPEIRQKRAAEARRIMVGIGALAVVGAIVGVYVFLLALVAAEQTKLGKLEAQSASIQKAIADYQIFEKQKQDVEAKKGIVAAAVAGEIPWYRLLNEVSLVIPSEVWLVTFHGDEKSGAEFDSLTADRPSDIPDQGHKPVAKWMVRLGEIPMLSDIWLTSSTKGEGTIDFKTTAKVTPPNSPAAAPAPPGAPPPPASAGG